MKKQQKLLAVALALVLVLFVFTSCTPARKPVPFNTNTDYRNYNRNTDSSYTAQNYRNNQNNVGNMGNTNADGGNQTSSLFSKLDYSFATITENINVRSEPDANSAIVTSLKSGDKVKIVGKLGNWYVVNVPNTNKVGCISPEYAKLYSAQPGTTEPEPSKPIPAAPLKAAGTGTTAQARPAGNAGGGNAAPAATGTGALSSQGSRILQLVNAERAKVGAKPLKSSTDLNKLATMKSQDMVEKNYFSHQSPTYGSPFDMLKTYGVSYMYAGENIATNRDADKVHQAWMNSEGHKKNILNPDFTEIGIGLYPKGNGSYAYTQLFIGK